MKKDPSLQNASHRWMLQVKAPSYVRRCFLSYSLSCPDLNAQSIHESIILKKVIVSAISEPVSPTFTTSFVVTDPPFCVMGVSDRPFLARIILEWAGTQNNPTHVEHWVDVRFTQVLPSSIITFIS